MPESRDGAASFWREAGSAFALVFRSPLAIFIFYGVAFSASFTVMHGADIQALAYLNSRQAYLWRVLSALAPTAWIIILVILLGDWERTRSAWPSTRKGRMATVLCLVVGKPFIILPLLAQYFVWQEDPLVRAALLRSLPVAASPTRNFLLNMLGIVSATLLATVILGIHIQFIDRLPELRRRVEQPESGGLEEDVRWYQRRRELLSRFLTLSGFIMGTSILSVSALRHLLNEALFPSTSMLPTAPILGYGVYYTGLLASIYLPAHHALKDVGQTLVERLARQGLGEHATWKQQHEEQEAARTWLGLRSSALQELQQGLSVLTPLLASISALILGPGG